MGSTTPLIVVVATSLGALVVCSISACDVPIQDCPGDRGCPPGGSSSSATSGTGGEGPAIDGVWQEGAVLCSVCAVSPFCYDLTQDPPVYVYVIDPFEPCPDNLAPAVPATRRSDANGGEESFYCIPPAGALDFDIPGTIWCPGGQTPILGNHSYVNECADGDPDCLPPECDEGGGGSGGQGGSADCEPKPAEILTLCGKDEAHIGEPDEIGHSMVAARQKIVDRAGKYHHPNVPGNINPDPSDPSEDPPDRYCFVTCFSEQYIGAISCDPADDPSVSLTSTFVSIDPDSEASVTVQTTDPDGIVQAITSSVEIEGTLAIDIPRGCRGLADAETASCEANIGSVLLNGRSDLVVQGFTISDLTLINRVNWNASAAAVGGTTTVTVAAALALVTGTVEPFGLVGMRPELAVLGGARLERPHVPDHGCLPEPVGERKQHRARPLGQPSRTSRREPTPDPIRQSSAPATSAQS